MVNIWKGIRDTIIAYHDQKQGVEVAHTRQA